MRAMLLAGLISTPGSDGSFTVRATHHPSANSGYKAYAFDVFMLEEVNGSPTPTITISGTPLGAFSSEPGTPSTEQSYTVAGSDLTTDIFITAPTDFEISTSSGSGFGPSVTLTQSGGVVAATPIYVRFNRATEGLSSGDITHTSDGATQQDVAVSGTAATPSSHSAGDVIISAFQTWNAVRGSEPSRIRRIVQHDRSCHFFG